MHQKKTIVGVNTSAMNSALKELTDVPSKQKFGDRLIVHVVLLDLIDTITLEQLNHLIDAIVELESIAGLHRLEIGKFKDLNDPRALNQYELVFSMAFETKADYEFYQQHPIHVQLKKIAGPLLSTAPATYDYSLEIN